MTEAEQNRLIVENMGIVPTVAADFRGRGVDFEDLLAIGRVGLCIAARTYDETEGTFSSWASVQIRSEIQDELKSGRNHLIGDEPETNSLRIEKIFEFDVWGKSGNTRAITERWPDEFDGSPETLALLFDEIKDKQSKFDRAFISLTPLERKLVTLVILRDPPLNVANAAREVGVSYLKSWRTLKRALSKMRKVILSMEANKGMPEAA